MRKSWDAFRVAQPEQSRELRLSHVVRPKGSRDFTGLVKLYKQAVRTTEVSMNQKVMEYCRRTFWSRYRFEGYTEDEILAMWEASTTADCFKQGLAFKKGSVVWVWKPLPRSASKKDIVACAVSGQAEEMSVGAGTAADMLFGPQALSVGGGSSVVGGGSLKSS